MLQRLCKVDALAGTGEGGGGEGGRGEGARRQGQYANDGVILAVRCAQPGTHTGRYPHHYTRRRHPPPSSPTPHAPPARITKPSPSRGTSPLSGLTQMCDVAEVWLVRAASWRGRRSGGAGGRRVAGEVLPWRGSQPLSAAGPPPSISRQAGMPARVPHHRCVRCGEGVVSGVVWVCVEARGGRWAGPRRSGPASPALTTPGYDRAANHGAPPPPLAPHPALFVQRS